MQMHQEGKTSKRRDSEKAAIPICKNYLIHNITDSGFSCKSKPSVCAVEVDRGAARIDIVCDN